MRTVEEKTWASRRCAFWGARRSAADICMLRARSPALGGVDRSGGAGIANPGDRPPSGTAGHADWMETGAQAPIGASLVFRAANHRAEIISQKACACNLVGLISAIVARPPPSTSVNFPPRLLTAGAALPRGGQAPCKIPDRVLRITSETARADFWPSPLCLSQTHELGEGSFSG
jgi:hypothetical protein